VNGLVSALVAIVLAVVAAPAAGGTPAAGRTASGADPVLVAAGDIACAPGQRRSAVTCRHADTAALAERLAPDVLVPLGDIQYETGQLRAFRASYDPTWGRLLDVTRPVPGNHEYYGNATGYFTYFGRRAGPGRRGWYSFDLGDWHVVALNSNCNRVGCGRGSAQERWLRADLARNARRCTLAVMHHPRFSSGFHGDYPPVAPLWKALEDARADVVLAGHDHDYERFDRRLADGRLNRERGLRSFVVGTGGKSLRAFRRIKPGSLRRNASVFGVLEMTLRTDGYAFRFVGLPGARVVDAGTGRCR
jgi:3',5'-cyclic AMP phosphodiesterase CpdA